MRRTQPEKQNDNKPLPLGTRRHAPRTSQQRNDDRTLPPQDFATKGFVLAAQGFATLDFHKVLATQGFATIDFHNVLTAHGFATLDSPKIHICLVHSRTTP